MYKYICIHTYDQAAGCAHSAENGALRLALGGLTEELTYIYICIL